MSMPKKGAYRRVCNMYTYIHIYIYIYIRSPVALTFFHASYALRELLCTDFSQDGSHKRR